VLTLFLTQLSEPRWIFRVATSGLCLSTWILVDGVLEGSLQVSTVGPHDPVQPQPHLLGPRPFWIALPLTAALLSFPRRPDVFTKDGKPIDGQLNVSLLSRYTLSWCSGLLAAISKKQPLEIGQFPALDGSTRVQELTSLRPNPVAVSKLWQRTIRLYCWILLKQHMFMILRAILTFGPSYSVQCLLERLEQCGQTRNGVWLAIAALGVSSVAENVVEYQLFWIQWSEIGIPYHAQLSMTVFEKALRRKDSKEPQWKASDIMLSRKSVPLVTNLLTTDVAQVSKFGSVNYILPAHILKLSLSIVFLWRLLGWQSLLVGVTINLIFIPLNLHSIKKVHMARKLLSSDRDRTMKAVTEALNALRQIKFSAREKQWEQYIQRLRELETAQLRKMFVAESSMSLCSRAGPTLLSVALLSTYVYVQGSITASVAFTAITLVEKMGGSLLMIPTLVSDIATTRICANRIDQFLELPEQTDVISLNASGGVSFQNASITWPSDSFHIKESNKMHSVETFALRSLNLEFPSGELSIISGKTGSGKTLLLSAIIGEVDVIDGIISAPKALERNSELIGDKSFSDAVLIPTDVAYVSQSPWLENTSIKKNILFGLPFRKERYAKVIAACALLPDLSALPAGDDTQVGVRGISLSGGQRWRVTLARALYSKAKLLVLDDVLSALDVHVGQEIFNALNGELGQGRTKILVTHHLSMCLPKTNYLVILGDGGVKYAGSPNKISAALDSLLEAPQPANTEREQSPSDQKDVKAVRKFEKSQNIGEHKANVNSSLKAFRKYMDASGGLTWWGIFIVGLVLKKAIDSGQTWLLRSWTHATAEIQRQTSTTSSVKASSGIDDLHYYMYLYLITSALFLLLEILYSHHKYIGSLKASKSLFRKMTRTILHMPLAWIDTVPIGQILDRFTGDFTRVDASLMGSLDGFINRIVRLLILFLAG
jgi:ABC-type multidrug transport system fused ATPase/permease subunit